MARAFVETLAAHRFAEAAAQFDAGMTEAVPVVVLAELWRKLEDAGGTFQTVEGAETDVEEGYRVARVTVRFAYRRKVLRVVLAGDRKVAGLFFGPVPAEIEETARALVDRLVRADFAGADAGFDAIMRASLPPEKLGAVWKQVVKRSGAFAEVRRAALVPGGGLSTVLLTCRFAKAEVVVKVVYDVRDQVAGLFFLPGDALAPWKPPAYAEPDRFVERDVSVGSAPALPGVLTLPKGQPPFPVVVLVHGSGPGDADGSVGASKVFKDIAWGLGGRGVAVLRYVKRTRHAPAGVVSIKEEVLDGAAAAVDLVTHLPEIDPKRVVVLGHSQGGYLAPRIAADNPAVAGLVLLAGPSRPLQDSLVDQLVYLARLEPGDAESKRLVEAARVFKARVEDPALRPDATLDLPGGSAERGRYFLSLRGYQPTDVAAKLTIPILVLQGNRDYQVGALDFDGWKKALGGKPGVTLKQYPGLNHLFITGAGPSRPAEYESPGHVDATVIDDLAAFVGRLP
jgi:dienelactone hydrolase